MNRLLLGVLIGSVATSAYCQSALAGSETGDKSDPAAALATWVPLAEKGDAEAEFHLGQAYLYGRGVPKDVALARNWFGRAASKGQVDAQATIGLLLYQDGDVANAMRWLAVAAEAGEPRAMLVLGSALYLGEGVAKDPVKAYAYTSRAAAKGLPQARTALADMEQQLSKEQRQQGFKLAMTMAGAKVQWPAKAPLKPVAIADASPVQGQPDANLRPKRRALPQPQPQIRAQGQAQARVQPQVRARVQAQGQAQFQAQPQARQPAKPIKSALVPAALADSVDGNWRIQLGAFSQRHSAEALFANISRKLPGRQAHYIPVKAMVRLQVGPFANRAAATAQCARLAPQPCFPVAIGRP